MLRSIGKYDNDKEIGIWKFYHKNGILKEIGRTKNGEQISKWKYYDEKGNLINIMEY
ncbi:toxin-antitoxin system YwqK family antitoxin [Empedobacter sedimenti]|uniref:hypothetical protein n=1 Tax=Empedobacter sedimenti TaxID=3042610 RepID=UPI0024A78EF3|nr:hypothetical protein [Empedobacter sedimenti]